ncbi:MAG: tetratricopeptide repeat protein, partial [Gemmatimonadales bacterium]
YADVFGEAGLQRYRELAEAVWNTVQPLEPGDDDPDRYGQRFRITQIMESLAQLSGDVEELVAVKQQDLSSSYAFLEIAEAYRRARKEDKALAWAEKGLRTFGGEADSRLKDLLAEMYHERERHDDAMTLVWPQFEGSPNIGNYRKLKRNADRNETWAEWRQRALNHIREFLDKNSSDIPAAHRRFSLWSDRSALVEIFLWENDPESAWQEASTGGCSDSLWLELANLRENDHPRDAIAVYQQLIVPIVNRTNNEAYAEAVALIRKIKSLMNSPAEQEEFRQYLTTLRTDFKRKRNLMKMLDTF